MAALLAFSAAVAYGVGDFFGGIAARRQPASAVVLWSHLVGLVMLLAVAPLVPGEPTTRALAVGAAAGILGGAGVALFYWGLAIGAMSVVAPIAALLSAAVPVVFGLASGERPEPAALVGIALALGAIVLVSQEEPGGHHAQLSTRRWLPIAVAVTAGVGFGFFFVLIGKAGDDVGIWPLVGARTASISLFVLLGMAGVTSSAVPLRREALPVVICGLLDAGANVFLLLALDRGLLSVVAVLTALYPAGTVLLARYVLGERLSRLQRTGLGVAAMAAVLIAL
jgi:drug/metabolite transporter (DMT)-like permease